MLQVIRIYAAFWGAVLAPTFLSGVLTGNAIFAAYVFVTAVSHAFVLGLPLYLVLSSKPWPIVLSSTVMGFVVGCLPTALLGALWPSLIGAANPWLGLFQVAASLGVCGAVAGLAFGLTLAVWPDTRG